MNILYQSYKCLQGLWGGIGAYGLRRLNYKPKMQKRIKQLLHQGIPIRKLTRSQKSQIRKFYRGEHFLYEGHQLYLTVNGEFCPKIFPEDLFRTKYEAKLNDQHWANVCYEKAFFERFMPDVRFSKSIIRSVEGFLYDEHFRVITPSRAKEILSEYDEIVFKPSDAWCGKGVKLMKTEEVQLSELQKSGNFVLQERIIQHDVLKGLNESSVNIVRVISLLKGTEVIILSSSLRIGAKGAFTDNASTPDGLGMIVIGIDENGCLRENGYYSCALPTKVNHDGVPFKGVQIPKFQQMIEIAKTNHPLIPKIRFIGWDFTLDEKGEVITMEINPKFPGVFYYQLANGPLFGDRTDEIYSWMKQL